MNIKKIIAAISLLLILLVGFAGVPKVSADTTFKEVQKIKKPAC